MSAAPAASFVPLAERLAEAAGAVSRRYFRTPTAVESKADQSPVTEADRAAEAAMRQIIAAEVPDHGILGEEYGGERTDAEYVWVLDPIDGTQAFVTGKPLFGTLISLVRRGVPVLGIIDQPVLGERWLGVAGRPTLFNGEAAHARPCSKLGDAWLYATSPHMFPPAAFDRFEALREQVRRAVYGGECYAYGLLASGFVDLVVEADLQPYDYCALAPVVTGAGGTMTDWRGDPLDLNSDGRVVAAGDDRMHHEALAVLARDG